MNRIDRYILPVALFLSGCGTMYAQRIPKTHVQRINFIHRYVKSYDKEMIRFKSDNRYIVFSMRDYDRDGKPDMLFAVGKKDDKGFPRDSPPLAYLIDRSSINHLGEIDLMKHVYLDGEWYRREVIQKPTKAQKMVAAEIYKKAVLTLGDIIKKEIGHHASNPDRIEKIFSE
ncbi:hypothetical protein COT47_00395 [Candidatus Woesearchaeota archaeon CG08_land_8_20_14_0_20_43_7]|nr:MAG: hypothetical protein COT47_00395 [Candidatus Woesearchaeota archaeon CG08_land_8_20_14_0_20_43_7]